MTEPKATHFIASGMCPGLSLCSCGGSCRVPLQTPPGCVLRGEFPFTAAVWALLSALRSYCQHPKGGKTCGPGHWGPGPCSTCLWWPKGQISSCEQDISSFPSHFAARRSKSQLCGLDGASSKWYFGIYVPWMMKRVGRK